MASPGASSTLPLAWSFEQLLTLPAAIMDDELVRHFAAQLVQPQASGKPSMPAPVSARMMLRHLSDGASLLPAKETLELLSLIHHLAQQKTQFRASVELEALDPGASGMLTDAVIQALVQRARSGPDEDEPDGAQHVEDELAQLLEATCGAVTQDDVQLQQRLSELQALVDGSEGQELQQLEAHYPDEAFHARVKAFAQQALAALGPTQLQVYAEECLAGSRNSSNAAFGDLYTVSEPAVKAEQQAAAGAAPARAAAAGATAGAVPAQAPQSEAQPETKRRRLFVDEEGAAAQDQSGSRAFMERGLGPSMPSVDRNAGPSAQIPAPAGNDARPSAAAQPDDAAVGPPSPSHAAGRASSPAPDDHVPMDAERPPTPDQGAAKSSSQAPAADAASPERPPKRGRTMEWDSPIEDDDARLQESRPSRQAPHTAPYNSNSQRRAYSRWTKEETELFIKLTQKYGAGNWEVIKSQGGDALDKRSSVDLKDKWRNLVKSRQVPS